jgi:hypothetical protein
MYAQFKDYCLYFCLVRLELKMEQNMTAEITEKSDSCTVVKAMAQIMRPELGPSTARVRPATCKQTCESKDSFLQVTLVI